MNKQLNQERTIHPHIEFFDRLKFNTKYLKCIIKNYAFLDLASLVTSKAKHLKAKVWIRTKTVKEQYEQKGPCIIPKSI